MTTDRVPRALDVEVAGGALRVAVWDTDAPDAATLLAVHGVTASHLAWQWLADALPEVRIVAPDLRGRGRSSHLPAAGDAGAAGMALHADDLARVAQALGLARTLVVGHSMGAFVSVVFAHRHPSRVSDLLLLDGGLPLPAPEGLAPDELVAAILGPTAARLSLRFDDVAAYLRFWDEHPAFVGLGSPALERYFAYDLVPDGDRLRPATSLETTTSDTVDLVGGDALTTAWRALDARAPGDLGIDLITVGRGLRDETPGLYPPAHLAPLLARHPELRHTRWDDLNHYTMLMTEGGAGRVAVAVRAALARR